MSALGGKINGKEHLHNNQPGDDEVDIEFNFEQLGLLYLSRWWAIKIDLGHCWVTKSKIVCCWWAIKIDPCCCCSVTKEEFSTVGGQPKWILAFGGQLKLIPIHYWCVIKREVLNHWRMTEMDLGHSQVAKILKFWKVLIIWQWTWTFLNLFLSLRRRKGRIVFQNAKVFPILFE